MNRRRFLKAALGVAGAALVPIPTPTIQASGPLTPDQVRRRLDRRLRSGLRQRLEEAPSSSRPRPRIVFEAPWREFIVYGPQSTHEPTCDRCGDVWLDIAWRRHQDGHSEAEAVEFSMFRDDDGRELCPYCARGGGERKPAWET